MNEDSKRWRRLTIFFSLCAGIAVGLLLGPYFSPEWIFGNRAITMKIENKALSKEKIISIEGYEKPIMRQSGQMVQYFTADRMRMISEKMILFENPKLYEVIPDTMKAKSSMSAQFARIQTSDAMSMQWESMQWYGNLIIRQYEAGREWPIPNK